MSARSNGRKTIFITGAASGIGLASAKRFAAAGWFVGLSDIDVTGLKAALEAIGPANGATFKLDVRDRQAPPAASAWPAPSGSRPPAGSWACRTSTGRD